MNRHLFVHLTEVHSVRSVPFNWMERFTTSLPVLGCIATADLNVWTTTATVTVADTVNGIALQFGHIKNTSKDYFAGTASVFAKLQNIFENFLKEPQGKT